MKYDCEVIRDLMPLCNDGTCSEQSRRMVGEHVLECPACMQMYQEMRTEVPGEPPVQSPDAAPFGKTVKQLRRKRGKRRALAVLAGVIVGLVLMLGGLYVLRCMTGVYNHVSDVGDYSFSLQRLPNGQILCTMTNLSGRAQQPFYAYDDNTHTLSMYALHPLIAPVWETKKTESVIGSLYWDEEHGLMYRTWNAYGYVDFPVLEVRQGSLEQQTLGPEILLYTRGQDIPLIDDGAIPIDSYIRSDVQSGSLLPFMTPTPTALPMATVPPTLEPGNSATLPPHTTLDPAAHTDRTQSTMMNHTDNLMLQKTLQTIVTYREATSSDMAGSTPTPQPTATP